MIGTCTHCRRTNRKLIPAPAGELICVGPYWDCHNHYLRQVVPQHLRLQVRTGTIAPHAPRRT